MDQSKYPHERKFLEGELGRSIFPSLGHDFEVLGPSTMGYNCIAHALGIEDWIEPQTGPAENPLTIMDELFANQGLTKLSDVDFDLQPDILKIVLYAILDSDGAIRSVTHAARQASDGSWTSKLGRRALIRHR